ncbi:hypothetical protein [Chitinolyticbacter meiyuanensis]|uniref:hypothetical protein n=1 Tax=Chitinolyticbacter meiyuanensis TaxID=682798 RepID=UPI0011E5E646|nr:hypothetical protein [Chitinolyticbacter meiyuanensis]
MLHEHSLLHWLKCTPRMLVAALTTLFTCSKALRYCVILQPLPLYWDALNKLDWHMLAEPEGHSNEGSSLSTQVKMYLRLRLQAEISTPHEDLVILFFEFGNGDSKPPRPTWKLY